ncbi:MAG: ribbon-helix-helix domain-containing protein [Thermoguttaceae bacterium]|jgi:metal-responsive CopG/Arc/MetJ family transcriptional regulator
MSASKVAISIDKNLLTELDRLVEKRVFSSRSQAIQLSVAEKLSRLRRRRLAEECAKLEPSVEKAAAEEGMAGELASWPEY